MDLAARLATPPRRTSNGPKCSVGLALQNASHDDRDAMQAALDDLRWTEPKLKEAIEADGGPFIGQGAIGKHRRRDCGCFRDDR